MDHDIPIEADGVRVDMGRGGGANRNSKVFGLIS